MTEHVRDHLGRIGVWRSAGMVTPELAAGIRAVRLRHPVAGRFAARRSQAGRAAARRDHQAQPGHRHREHVAGRRAAPWPRRSPASRPVTRAGSCSAWARVTGRRPRSTPGPTTRSRATSTPCSADGVPAQGLVLAALGPKVLAPGRGSHRGRPSLPGHARVHAPGAGHPRPGAAAGPGAQGGARDRPGPGPCPRPDQRVRNPYLGLVNYTSNLRRLGWGDADLSDGGSDELIDALVAQGSADEVGGADAGAPRRRRRPRVRSAAHRVRDGPDGQLPPPGRSAHPVGRSFLGSLLTTAS